MDDYIDGDGGGSNNDDDYVAIVSMLPDPADRETQRKELQPCTWARAAPYIVFMLAGAALLAGGLVVVVARSCPLCYVSECANYDRHVEIECAIAIALAICGALALVFVAAVALSPLSPGFCLPWLDNDQADEIDD